MIYKEKVIVAEVVDHEVAPCIVCNSNEMEIDEYEDTFGCISTITCTRCKKEVKANCNAPCVIKKWNSENDIKIIIENKNEAVRKLLEEIILLEKKLIDRNSLINPLNP